MGSSESGERKCGAGKCIENSPLTGRVFGHSVFTLRSLKVTIQAKTLTNIYFEEFWRRMTPVLSKNSINNSRPCIVSLTRI